MTVTRKRYLILAIVCLIIIVMLFPIPSTIVPQWRLQVMDVNGTTCPNMRVTQSWGHYALFIDGNYSSDDRFTDANGYVQFPARTVSATLPRRLMMPVVTRIATIMHGGWGVDSAVWASGIKDVAWLSYRGGKSLPDKMRVERCLADGTEQIVGRERRGRTARMKDEGGRMK